MGDQTLFIPSPEYSVVMLWTREAALKSSSDHGLPSTLKSQECSHNPTVCVPFKTKKLTMGWPSEEFSHHCGFSIDARAHRILRKIFLVVMGNQVVQNLTSQGARGLF